MWEKSKGEDTVRYVGLDNIDYLKTGLFQLFNRQNVRRVGGDDTFESKNDWSHLYCRPRH